MFIRILLATCVFAYAVPAYADDIGSFTASKACPLLQSKRNSTNPGNLSTTVGKSYAVLDALPPKDPPTWVRVEVGDDQGARWVEASCGTVRFAETQPDSCHLPGTFDSNVLAISWQPGFCARTKKPECDTLKQNTFATSHFTLHGLWPNRTGCDKGDYSFCGTVKKEIRGSFCEFPDDGLDPLTSRLLGRVMPSVKQRTCLDRHEWWKHGTCRASSADKYFLEAMDLLFQINGSAFVDSFVQANLGKTTTRQKFDEAFDSAFGKNASKKIKLTCGKNNSLSEIQINLPKELNAELPDLLAKAADNDQGDCKSSVLFVKP
jgi:ribonuclease T2